MLESVFLCSNLECCVAQVNARFMLADVKNFRLILR